MTEDERKGLFSIIDEKNSLTIRTISIQDEFSRRKTVFVTTSSVQYTFLTMSNKITYNYSFEDYISDHQFLKWSERGPFLNLDIMKKECGIETITEHSTKDECLLYLEYVYNILPMVVDKEHKIFYKKESYNAIKDTIEQIITEYNYEFKKCGTKMYLVVKDPAFDIIYSSVDIITQNNIIEYRSLNTVGNIEKKKQILCSLAAKIESVKNTVEGSMYNELFRDTSFLLNNLSIRHGNSNQIHVPEEQIEMWYDRTYDLCMLTLFVNKHIDILNDIETLKAECRKK